MAAKTTRKPIGRKGSRVFPSMGNAASQLDLSQDTLKRAKAQGCPAFYGDGRICEKTLLKWLKDHQGELAGGEGPSLKDQKIAEEVRRLKNKNDEDEGRLIPVDQVKEDLQTALASQRSILSQRLLNEYPSQVAGLSPEQGRIYAKRLFDQLCLEMQHIADRYGSKTG